MKISAREKIALSKLDARLIAASKGIRLLSALSWPAELQTEFLKNWRAGKPALPKPVYTKGNWTEVRKELSVVKREATKFGDNAVADFMWRTAESFFVATRLLDCIGKPDVSKYSIELFGKPGDELPGSEVNNIDAAQHFIQLANELSVELVEHDNEQEIPVEILREELETEINAFFVNHKIKVEIDPALIAKAAAGPRRIRLRSATAFTEYDKHQLLEHEAFVHSLTAINGSEQTTLKSLALNSPRITATQEGLATFAELITGAIDITRMKRISLRIVAIDMTLKGADFMEIFEFFLESGASEEDSFTSASRIFRGVKPTGGAAFTKDTVYLHGLLSVHTFFRWALKNKKLKHCRHLFAGKMTLQDTISLEPWFDSGLIDQPVYLPRWVSRANGLAGMLAFSLFANKIRLDKVTAEDLMAGKL